MSSLAAVSSRRNEVLDEKPTSREGELEARTRRISRFVYYLPFRLSWPFLSNPLPYGGALALNGINVLRYQRNGS